MAGLARHLLMRGLADGTAGLADHRVTGAARDVPTCLCWLAALRGAFVIHRFEGTIARLVSLATLMPLVAGMGGNAGTQALTVTVRPPASGELSIAGTWRTIRKELTVGLLNGGTFLVAGAALAMLWYGEPVLAGVFGAALLLNLVVAAVLGTTIPLRLGRGVERVPDPGDRRPWVLRVPGPGEPVPAVEAAAGGWGLPLLSCAKGEQGPQPAMISGGRRHPGDRLDEVLGQLYAAAVDDGLWPAALTAMGDLSSSIGGHLLVWDLRRRAPVASVMGDRFPEVNSAYVAHYGAIDPRLRLVMTMPVGRTLACHHHFDDGFIRRDEFYNDFLLPNGARYVAGCRLLETAGVTTVLGLHRGPQHGPFEAADMELFGRLLPHLQRAAVIRQKLEDAKAERAMRQAALDRLPTAVFVVAGTGAVLAMNQAGHELVRVGDALVLRQGRLSARRSADEARLSSLVREAADAAARRGGGGGSARLSRDGGGAYAALVAPLAADQPAGAAVPAALVLISDPTAAPATLGTTLVKLYGFSQAEARLAVLLAQGRTLKEAADERGVGLETVRSQLHSLLAKSGVHRQANLVRLLARLPEMRSMPDG